MKGQVSPPRPTTLLPSKLKVVEMGDSVATAVSGRFLHKMGADVTRILPSDVTVTLDELEPRIGTGDTSRSAVAEWLHQGKELVTANLSDSDSRNAVDTRLSEADVILFWGTEAEWSARGLSPDRVTSLAPHAVIGHLTAWGDNGPYTDLRDDELLLQATSGFLNLLGVIEREPVRLGGRPLQTMTGLLALDGVMIGLFRRQNTGQGARFSISEFEAAAHVEWKIATFVQAGMRRELRGEDGGGPAAVRCRDGHFAMFFMPRHWDDVKSIIGDPRLNEERFATPASRQDNLAEMVAIVEDSTRTMSKKALYHQFQAKDIPAGYVATMSDLRTSPQYRARNFFEPLDVDGVSSGELPDAPWQVLKPNDIDSKGEPA